MANNTGNKQAVIAYKVRNTDGAPLDINGQSTSDSGLKQAILLLVGAVNPNPALYEIQGYFQPDSAIYGVPSVKLTSDCAAGVIFLSVAQLVFIVGTAPQTLTLTSSANWDILSAGSGIVTIDPVTGISGTTLITVTRTSTVGETDIVFRNTLTGDTATLHLINATADIWILSDGAWNMLGFWKMDAIWTTI